MESSIAVFLMRQSACELLPTKELVGTLNRKSDDFQEASKEEEGNSDDIKMRGEETRVAGEAGGSGAQFRTCLRT